jgi:hypothetical protein
MEVFMEQEAQAAEAATPYHPIFLTVGYPAWEMICYLALYLLHLLHHHNLLDTKDKIIIMAHTR